MTDDKTEAKLAEAQARAWAERYLTTPEVDTIVRVLAPSERPNGYKRQCVVTLLTNAYIQGRADQCREDVTLMRGALGRRTT